MLKIFFKNIFIRKIISIASQQVRDSNCRVGWIIQEHTYPLLEVPPAPAAHDVDVRPGKPREPAEKRADLGRRRGEVGVHLELAQRAVVVEEDRPGARPREPP